MIKKLKEKYVFFDIDGTLSEYRFKDRLYGGECPEFGCQSLKDLLFNDLFYRARPLKTMQRIIENLDSNKIFVLGAVTINTEIDQKYKWLSKYYPNIKRENVFFVCSTFLKQEVIIKYCKHYKIDIKQTAFVDDRIDVLRKTETLGIDSCHPSCFTEQL